MANSTRFSQEDSRLISQLFGISKSNPRLVRSSEYKIPAEPDITINSWKMDEYKYNVVPSPFPTLARGLFTTEIDTDREITDDRDRRYRIVVRGYDKFFNIGEVPWTTWPAIKTHTSAPYTLTLKSNGCIIFIAALTPSKILVTSKHSLGPLTDTALSHAQAGEGWLRKYLEKKGRSEEDLAKVLWDNKWTAIAELCDDSFEEHVLPYPPEKTGLHLHGINLTTKQFTTLPQAAVDKFAEEWGFIKTESISLNTVEEVQKFSTECAETGEWNGEAVEGFVVRTHVAPDSGGVAQAPASAEEKGKAKTTHPPYPPGSTFFFKIKFDEPYMMYRDWREITKSLITQRTKAPNDPLSLALLPSKKMQRKETRVYARWVRDEIERDLAQFDGFNKGKGIIATRERFQRWLETEAGKKATEEVMEDWEDLEHSFVKTIILPIAIPGCGKTTVANALVRLFDFGHTQSDDVKSKKLAPVFLRNVEGLLKKHDVVIADKNNHIPQHREQLREVATKFVPQGADTTERKRRVRLVALDWSHAVRALPSSTVHRLCASRIMGRGDNHQTLTPEDDHEGVVWMFINQLEELSVGTQAGPAVADEDGLLRGVVGSGGGEVDVCIEMDLQDEDVGGQEEQATSLDNSIRKAIVGVVKALKLEMPTEERIVDAITYAKSYVSPTIIKAREDALKNLDKAEQSQPTKKEKKKTPRYYGFLPELHLAELLGKHVFANLEEDDRKFWVELKDGKKVTTRPHVTIVHSKELPQRPSEGQEEEANTPPTPSQGDDGERKLTPDEAQVLWDRCVELKKLKKPAKFKFTLGHVVWNERIMAVTVDNVVLAKEGEARVDSAEANEDSSSTAVAVTESRAGAEFIEALPDFLRDRFHITVGTADNDIPAVEGGWLVRDWRKGGRKEKDGNVRAVKIGEEGLDIYGAVKGLSG
ncbi:hypothetical protein BDN72DRAFT_525109 [Pluteus cervinus]|uniref:Uncharacterized protein n=1 Tax=Pluteus cervinus TaxID=181527 RepID=A0ACD3AY59_9AGAR|nr:hypothetical protein BDN72DRAFT_525109 [Pluteus cervinus]